MFEQWLQASSSCRQAVKAGTRALSRARPPPAGGRESGVVHRFERELQIGVCDVDVRGGRLRVIGKEGE